MEEDKILKKHVKEINKAFKTYDIKNYDTLSVYGDSFPINKLAKDLKVKDSRSPKKAMENSLLPDQLRKSGIKVNQEEEEFLKQRLPYINYYRLSVFRFFTEENNNSLTRMYEIYEFDNYLRREIWNFLTTIEITIKTTLAYSI
ncbi:Abi family protein, partial [Streptococcus uberis]